MTCHHTSLRRQDRKNKPAKYSKWWTGRLDIVLDVKRYNSIMDGNTCPFIIQTFRKGMEQWWLLAQPVCWKGPIPLPEDGVIGQAAFEGFLNQQHKGSDQAVREHTIILWGKANTLLIRARALLNEPEWDKQWTVQLIKNGLWNFGIACWTSRNSMLYGISDKKKDNKSTQELA